MYTTLEPPQPSGLYSLDYPNSNPAHHHEATAASVTAASSQNNNNNNNTPYTNFPSSILLPSTSEYHHLDLVAAAAATAASTDHPHHLPTSATATTTASSSQFNFTTPSPSSDSQCESPRDPYSGHAPAVSAAAHGMAASSTSGLIDAHGGIGGGGGSLTPPNSASGLVVKDEYKPPPPSASVSGSTQFSDEQIDCICDSLQQKSDVKRLEQFLQMYSTELRPKFGQDQASEAVMRAKAFVAFKQGRYRELYNIIETREFDVKHHGNLQDMWYRAHYKEAEGVRGRSLGKKDFR